MAKVDDQRLADAHVRRLETYERFGVRAASRIGFRSMSATIRAFTTLGEDPGLAFFVEMEKAAKVLAEARVVAHLRAIRDGILATKDAVIDFELSLKSETELLKRQLDLTDQTIAQIEAVHGAEAAAVMVATGTRVQRAITETLAEARASGLLVRDGVKALRDTFEKLGITPRNSATFETMFRTSIQESYAAASWQFDQQPEIQEILWGYRYVTAGDARVRPTHQGMDGTTLPKEDPFWKTSYPPNGFNCRCQVIRLTESPESEVPVPDTFTTTQNGKQVTVVPGPDPGFAVNFGRLAASGA